MRRSDHFDASLNPLISLAWAARMACAVLAAAGCVTVQDPDASKRTPAQSAEAHRNLGIDHINNDRIPLAIRELRHAVQLHDEDAVSQLWLGHAYLLRSKRKEALLHTERALELDPSSHEVRIQLSTLYTMAGRFGEAIAHADILVDDPTFPTPWRALTNRGWAQIKQRRLTLARSSLEEALEFRPRHWPALLNLGILEQAEGDHLASLRYFEQVRALGPGPGPVAEANYRMAEAYVSLGHRSRALHHLEAAIEVAPHGRWGRQSREYLALLN